MAIQSRPRARTVETLGWLAGCSVRLLRGAGRRTWRAAAEQLEGYRDRYHIDSEGLGDRPRDLGQLREGGRACQQTIGGSPNAHEAAAGSVSPARGQTLEIG